MTATNNRMFERLTSLHFGSLWLEQISIILAWTLRHLEIFASYAQLCLNKWKTGRHNTLPLWKNLNILKQTLSKKLMTRPANNGCGEGSYVSHAIIKRNFEGTTRAQERCRHSRWRMFRIWKSFCKVKIDFWGKKNGTLGVLDIFTKIYVKRK